MAEDTLAESRRKCNQTRQPAPHQFSWQARADFTSSYRGPITPVSQSGIGGQADGHHPNVRCSATSETQLPVTHSQIKFRPFVAESETQPLIQPVGFRSPFVRCELNTSAIALSGLVNRPLEHHGANTSSAVFGCNMDCLNRGAPPPPGRSGRSSEMCQRQFDRSRRP